MGTNGYEVWIEYRRTGFPDVPAAPAPTGTPGVFTIPVRLLYPTSEINTNPNVPQQQTADAFNKKVFWDN